MATRGYNGMCQCVKMSFFQTFSHLLGALLAAIKVSCSTRIHSGSVNMTVRSGKVSGTELIGLSRRSTRLK